MIRSSIGVCVCLFLNNDYQTAADTSRFVRLGVLGFVRVLGEAYKVLRGFRGLCPIFMSTKSFRDKCV